jgi:uncharacterized protein YcfJ
MKILAIPAVLALVAVAGCNTVEQDRALIGGGLGAATGAVIGAATGGGAGAAVAGAAIGGVAGAAVGAATAPRGYCHAQDNSGRYLYKANGKPIFVRC